MDSIRAQQWHLDAMHADEMWKTSTGKGVVIGLVDSGVQEGVQDLSGQILPGVDLSGLPGGVGSDPVGHGTHMAADMVGTGKNLNGQGGYGLAPGAKVLPIKVDTGGTDAPTTASQHAGQLAQGIIYAADHGIKIINVSQGYYGGTLTPADLDKLKAAAAHAASKGALVFASAGNDGAKGNPINYPAALPGFVSVAGVDRDGKAWSDSEHNSEVDLAAPAVEIYGACTSGSGYCKGDGTSDSAALASASAALIWSVHPEWTANQVLRVMINTASNPSQRSDFLGYGVIRPRIALTNPGDPGPADVSPLPAAGGSSAPSTAGRSESQPPNQDPTGQASAPADAPVSAAPSGGSPAKSAAPVAESKDSSGSGSTPLIIGGAVVGVLVLVLVVVLIVRRNRPSGPGPVPPGAVPPPGAAPYGAPQQQPYPAPGQGQVPPPPAPAPAPGYGQQQPAAGPYGQPPQPPAAPGGYGQQPPAGGNPYAR
ncbi:putative peptidase S08 family protein [Kitasatospora setae KM-6054]|uniref:Putative peptidase S08 family protein n=1 Tax=Kitasatospora setae (strain ATCC 33774 / DSM 43861 / JCM 3304 / KCC A-0304 / NBRC 14216 / KM-6054) TaxID=452652 RepID=E4NBM3_KITSK|nr:putative peptidase S08 family protein [Kitasatospora setae KM-6054]